VELLAELFIDTRDPNHIYNQARCFEQNHRYEDAVSRYREFLKKSPNLSANDRADVEKQIAECQGYLQPSAATAKQVPVVAPAAVPAEVLVPGPAEAAASDGRGMRIAGLAVGAVGLASLGTAIYFYTRATSLSDKITNAKNSPASDFDAGKSAQTMQWVCYGVGIAALATGSVLYYLGWRAAGPGQTALVPVAGPGLAGLAAQGAF
jgi:tetratricopeptide (TPR) repeat protein